MSFRGGIAPSLHNKNKGIIVVVFIVVFNIIITTIIISNK